MLLLLSITLSAKFFLFCLDVEVTYSFVGVTLCSEDHSVHFAVVYGVGRSIPVPFHPPCRVRGTQTTNTPHVDVCVASLPTAALTVVYPNRHLLARCFVDGARFVLGRSR